MYNTKISFPHGALTAINILSIYWKANPFLGVSFIETVLLLAI